MLEYPKGSPLSVFSALWDFFPKIKIFPLQFFDVLRQNGCWKTPKGPPFSFSALWDFFFQNLFFSPKGPLFNCDKNVDNFGSVPLLARHSVRFFAFSTTVNGLLEVLLLFSSLGYGADLGRSRLVQRLLRVSYWNTFFTHGAHSMRNGCFTANTLTVRYKMN